MKKILFLLDELPPTKSANGICVSKVIESLNSDGYETSCICWKANGQYLSEIHLIPEKPWKQKVDRFSTGGTIEKAWFQILRVAYKVKRIFLLPIWPVDSCKTARNFYATASNLIDGGNIAAVVAVNYPGETLLAMRWLKKKYGDKIKTVMYPLDVSYVNPYCGKIERAVSSHLCPRFMRSCSRYADMLLELENAQDMYNAVYTEKEQLNFKLCGIPLLEQISKVEEKAPSNEVHFIYTGTLQRNIRDPEMAFSVLHSIAMLSNKKVVLDLYGQIDSQSRSLYDNGKFKFEFINHGWIVESELVSLLRKSDVLISLGNLESHLIPSKLFKYMSTGKPIMHFCLTENDPCIDYLIKYGNARIIHSGTIYDDNNLNDVVKFVENGTVIDRNLKNTFPKCFPEYTANLLKELID